MEKKSKPTSKNHIVHFRLNEQELAYIKERANQAGIKPSTYMRNACLNAKIHSNIDFDVTKALLQESANLGRLGGLFKLWFTAPKTFNCTCRVTTKDRTIAMKIIDKIYTTQSIMCDKVDEILKKRNP